MRNAGITTQYGFLYQKYWFFYTLLNENNHYNYLTFEGLDDIEEFVSDDLLKYINSHFDSKDFFLDNMLRF